MLRPVPVLVFCSVLFCGCGDANTSTTDGTITTATQGGSATETTAATGSGTAGECGELFDSNCFSDTDWSCSDIMCINGEWSCSCVSLTGGPTSDSDSSDSDSTDSDATGSDSTDSDATESDATDSDATDSDATDSDATGGSESDSATDTDGTTDTDTTDSETSGTDSQTDSDTSDSDTGGFDPFATVDIYIDNFCNVSADPMELWVPADETLQITYHNNSVDYDADVWLSYGGGYLGLVTGGTWEDPFTWCAGPEPYTGGADIDIAGGGGNSCPGVTVLIHCE